MRKTTPWGVWDHLPLDEVVSLFRGLNVPWWVAGGYAIDAVAGEGRRDHDDVDIGVFEADQLAVRQHLAEWELHFADPPGKLQPWTRHEWLAPHVHDIWVRRDAHDAWRFQLMLNPGGADEFVYRRDERIRLRLQDATHIVGGVRYLAPEVQLLFKSRLPREKDQQDFRDCLSVLNAARSQWLADALTLVDPANPWLGELPRAREWHSP